MRRLLDHRSSTARLGGAVLASGAAVLVPAEATMAAAPRAPPAAALAKAPAVAAAEAAAAKVAHAAELLGKALRAGAGAAALAVTGSKGLAVKSARPVTHFSGAETYSAWLLAKYQPLVVRWASVAGASCAMHVFHPTAAGTRFCSITALVLLACICTVWASKKHRPQMVRDLPARVQVKTEGAHRDSLVCM